MYCLIDLTNHTIVRDYVGDDTVIPNGCALWPIIDTAASYDPATQELGTYQLTVDQANSRVVGSHQVVTLSASDQSNAALYALTTHRLAAIERVDTEAEQVRLKYLTPGSGQAAVYIRKADEAARYASQGDAGAPYTLLDASIGIEGTDRASVAAAVNAQAAAWTTVAAQIETLRLGTKKTLAAATTIAAIDAVFPIAWP